MTASQQSLKFQQAPGEEHTNPLSDHGRPSTAAPKPGWRRVSTRQWIRDFRDNIAKFQVYPYKSICGMFFWSFGYYPDMVDPASYQKYVAKYPHSSGRKASITSGHTILGPSETDLTTLMSTTDMSASEKDTVAPSSTTDSNANLSQAVLASKKKGMKDYDPASDAGIYSTTDVSEAQSETIKTGKGKREKSSATRVQSSTGLGKKGKGLKGKVESGRNISFNPTVYDLSTLTIMNLPPGTNGAKLSKLFPGAKISIEGGAAAVKFKDASTAEPFLSKDIVLDGQKLVVSPKLKM